MKCSECSQNEDAIVHHPLESVIKFSSGCFYHPFVAPTVSKGGTDTRAASGTLPLGSSDSRVVPSVAAPVPSSAEGVGTGEPDIVKLADALVACDGHLTSCNFRGCTCGSVEDYKIARANYIAGRRKMKEVMPNETRMGQGISVATGGQPSGERAGESPIPEGERMSAREQFEECIADEDEVDITRVEHERMGDGYRSTSVQHDWKTWQEASSLRGTGERELEQLRAWKESASAVWPDMQKIGKLIGVQLGDSVHDKIIPWIEAAESREAKLKLVIERDRSLVCDGVNVLKSILRSREWLGEGRGCYEWDDDRWHDEFKATATEIRTAIEGMEKIAADLSNSPTNWDDVQKARAEREAKLRECLRVAIEWEADYRTRNNLGTRVLDWAQWGARL